MTQIERHLITTADERTWKFDRPVIFLGEWCCLYERRHVWSKMDAIIAEPFGLELGAKKIYTEYVQALADKLLIEIVRKLNNIHATTYSIRYWNIILGDWLQRYVAIMFNRYKTIELALRKYKISGTTYHDFSNYTLATNDFVELIWATNDDFWNHVLYAKILHFLDKGSINDFVVKPENKYKAKSSFTSIKKTTKSTLKQQAYFILSQAMQALAKKNDAFIVNTFLPKWQEIQLQIALLQFPQIWRSPVINECEISEQFRENLYSCVETHKDFENFLRFMVWQMIPACYLEGYAALNCVVEKLRWPKSPKFIFTSNNFFGDEVFKFWVASKVGQGVPYYIGQHGNNYGTFIGNKNWPERKTPDKFFTWGWSEIGTNTVPAFNFKLSGRLSRYNPKGGLLLIEISQPHRRDPEDGYFIHGQYQEEQFQLVRSLTEEIKKNLIVRFHAAYSLYKNWGLESRWRDFDPMVRIEKGSKSIMSLIAQSRLIVHSYDSTGILETLSMNIPTICFWRDGFDHLDPSAKPYYESLKNAGIFFETPKHAANHISRYWNNIDVWWFSKEVQDARKYFCDKYSRIEKKPVRSLRKLLLKQLVE